MIETIHDLEAIREALQLPIWHFAGTQQVVCLDFYTQSHIQNPTITSRRWSRSK